MKPIRCVVCRTEFNNSELKDAEHGCPVCGYKGLTMLTNGDLNIDINWFELRTICMWAESLALEVGDEHSVNAFYGIVKAIKDQLPECGKITIHEKSPSIDEIEPPEGALLN
jgi:DNA-directed RNA polymerase subunit RPC12/RpoP